MEIDDSPIKALRHIRPFNVGIAKYFEDHIPAIIIGEVINQTYRCITQEKLRVSLLRSKEVAVENNKEGIFFYVRMCDITRKSKFIPLGSIAFKDSIARLIGAGILVDNPKRVGNYKYYMLNINSEVLKKEYYKDKQMMEVWAHYGINLPAIVAKKPYNMMPIHQVARCTNSWRTAIILSVFDFIYKNNTEKTVEINDKIWLYFDQFDREDHFPWMGKVQTYIESCMCRGEKPVVIRHEKDAFLFRFNYDNPVISTYFGYKNVIKHRKYIPDDKSNVVEVFQNEDVFVQNEDVFVQNEDVFVQNECKSLIYKYNTNNTNNTNNTITILKKAEAFEKTERGKKATKKTKKTFKSKEKTREVFKSIFFLQLKNKKIFKNFLKTSLLEILKEKNLKIFQEEKASKIFVKSSGEFTVIQNAVDDFVKGVPTFMRKYPNLHFMYQSLGASDFVRYLYDWFMFDPCRGVPPALLRTLRKNLEDRNTLPVFLHTSNLVMHRMACYLLFQEYPEALQVSMLSGIGNALAHDDIENLTAFFVGALRSKVTLEYNRDILNIDGKDFPVFTVYPTPVTLHRTYCLIDLPMLVPEFQEFMDSVSTWDTPEDIYAGCLYFREMHRRTYEYHRSLPCLQEFIDKT